MGSKGLWRTKSSWWNSASETKSSKILPRVECKYLVVSTQGRRDDFESGGARYQYRESGPLSSKKVGGPDYMFYPISTQKWGGPGPPGPYPYYAPVRSWKIQWYSYCYDCSLQFDKKICIWHSLITCAWRRAWDKTGTQLSAFSYPWIKIAWKTTTKRRK